MYILAIMYIYVYIYVDNQPTCIPSNLIMAHVTHFIFVSKHRLVKYWRIFFRMRTIEFTISCLTK